MGVFGVSVENDKACRVMGILNLTPDSFSDGGRFTGESAVHQAVAAGLQMVADGVDVIDLGGESTRPGAERVSQGEEVHRVIPAVRQLRKHLSDGGSGVQLSVDTTRAEVAEQAVAAGASIVNDVSGGLADPRMLATVADLGVRYILMHWRAPSATMHAHAHYRDVVGEVYDELAWRCEAAVAAGIAPDAVVIDPGLGFAKEPQANWTLLAGLERFGALGFPILVGASRKRFLGELLADAQGAPRPVVSRDAASLAVATLAAQAGVWGVRVHDVGPTCDAVRVVARLRGL